MIRRALTGLIGAAVLTLSLALPSLAASPIEPISDETSATGFFTQNVKGVVYEWTVLASRDTVLDTTFVGATSFGVIDTICQDGSTGSRSIQFIGQTSVPILIPASLRFAIAGARVYGTETTSDSCTGTETQVDKTYAVALALVATSRAVTSSGQKCIDAEHLLISTFTFRAAAGSGFINGQRLTTTNGTISHGVMSLRSDSSCADA
jgi:hypothetical protein